MTNLIGGNAPFYFLDLAYHFNELESVFTPIIGGKYMSKRRVLFSYLVTYLIIITILFLVIGSFSYFYIMRVEREKAKTEMKQAVNRMVEVMDANLRGVINIASTLYTNLEVSRIRKMDANFESREFIRFLNMSETLSRHTSTSQLLDRIIIYFHNNQLFIASDMLGNRPEIFFDLAFPNEGMDYNEWRALQMQHKPGVFFVTQDSPEGYVNLYYRLPIVDPIKGVTVIAGIKVGELINNLGLTDKYNDSAIILTDGEGNILFSNCELASTLVHLAGKNPDSSNVLVGQSSYEWCSERLSLLDWKVSFFVSTKDIYAESKRIQQNFIVVYIVVFVSSTFLALLFSKRISDPVVSLIDIIDGYNDVSSSCSEETGQNTCISFVTQSLNYVLRRVTDISNDYSNLVSRMQEYKQISREMFYNRLLKGEIISPTEIKMIEEDDILNYKYYTVALARIISNERKSINLAMFASSEMFSNMAKKGLYFCKTVFDRFAIIICRDNLPDKEEIVEIIESLQDKINFDSLASLRWGIGDTVTTYDQIYVSYRNAEYALYGHSMDSLDTELIVWYDKEKQNNRLTYNFDDAQRIYTLICNEDSEAAIQAIKGLMDRNIKVLEASKLQRDRFVSMLSETTLLLVSKLPDLDHQLEREIEKILRQMKRADSIDGIMECASMVVEKLCLSVKLRNKDRNQNLVDKITAFIDENYNDPNLSLATIARFVKLTENYVSSFFKENKGITIQNYIQQKRMTKAAELLEKTSMPVSEIVEQIGYNSTNTFYKAFKRYYGITPKNYKEYRQSIIQQ